MALSTRTVAEGVGAVVLVAATWAIQGWRYDAQIADIERNRAVAISNAQAAARNKEKEYAKLNAKIDGQYLELAAAQNETANLRASIAGGGQRLSVRTVPGTRRVPEDAAGSGLDDEAARADIDQRDAVDIIGIVARGDEAIRQLNALQDRELQIEDVR